MVRARFWLLLLLATVCAVIGGALMQYLLSLYVHARQRQTPSSATHLEPLVS